MCHWRRVRNVDKEKTVFKRGDGRAVSHPDVMGPCCCDNRMASLSPTEFDNRCLRPRDARPDQYFCEMSCPANIEMPDIIQDAKGSDVGPACVYVLFRTTAKSGGVCEVAHGSPKEDSSCQDGG